MNRIVAYLYLLLFASICYSQNTIAFPKDSLLVNRYGQKQGLLQLNPESLVVDSEGFLWAGTEDGLHKFNGYNFHSFIHNPRDTTSIPDDHIRDLLHINDTLWIATNTKGIIGYSIQNNSFFAYQKFDESDLSIGYKTFQLNQHTLLFSLRNHCILYNKKNNTHELVKLPKESRENFITCFYQYSDSIFYLGTKETGIQKLDLNHNRITAVQNNLKDTSINGFLKWNNQYYLATDKGLYSYDKTAQTFTQEVINHLEINDLLQFDDHTILLATTNGLYTFNNELKELRKIILKDYDNDIYKNVEIAKILKDDNGNYWFGTAGNGLLHFNIHQQKFTTQKIRLPNYPEIKKINSFGFIKDSKKNIWIASGIGLIKYNPKQEAYRLYKEGNQILMYDLNITKDGTLWAGGFDCGLLKYNETNDSFKSFTVNNGLSDNQVIEIITRPNNKLWVCTWTGGINEFDIEKETFSPVTIQNKQINRARISFIDSKQNLWIGCDEGLYKISPNNNIIHFINNETDSPLASNRIFAINEDSKHNIWVGTSTGITKIYENHQTTSYYQQKGLPNDFIYGLLIDKNDKIWVSTNYGISVFNPEKEAFTNFTERDGLQNNEFNGKAAYQDEDGNFYFGGVAGYNIIDPEKPITNQKPPCVYIESIELFNKPIQRNEMFKDTLHFNASENVLTINYAALNYLNPEKSLYQFKLSGFDKSWRQETKERATTYTNLEPGIYTFKLRATDDLGNWSKLQDQKVFIITPPWYKTTWFKFVLLFGIITLATIGFKLKTNSLKKTNAKLEDLVIQRTYDLKQNNELLEQEKKHVDFLLKELKHRVNNNFQLITSFLNIQTKSVQDERSKEILKIAKNRINTIANIQEYLNNKKEDLINISQFIEDSCKKIVKALGNDDDLKFNVIFKTHRIPSHSKSNPTLLGLLLNEMITNVHKHAFDKQHADNTLIIETKQEETKLKLVISDNGKGFDPSKTSTESLGLNLIEEMIEQLGATYTIESTGGTKYTVWIPLKEF
ncbi:Two-component sensor histidine kinase, contains HisKA and HATPase domains [Pustulibacterium marinum]|uniref:Two-component sensor histidine kinase, contains HisKA and HATPase domains n=1 Tax=Pustulibacterium marinum TaxID=1224947 RepID=A0A1I7H5J9_9FLAO|nr:two-component regulator propeller domain-containing protein [Pustulibacterium marinum]SFU55948.1 Two-component sensor histidine kinase, contains HisKA and HATPase domains [Pustulibacterium marinum]